MKAWAPLIDGKGVDMEVAEEAICEECGAGMEYYPEYDDYGEYHAWAVCVNPECDHEFEF